MNDESPLLPQMIERHIRSVPKGMTLRSSRATSDEGRKFGGTLRGANAMTCHINATCNTYTMTNHFSNETTLASLEALEKQHAQLGEEHQRISRKYRVSKVLLKEFVDIMESTASDDKQAQISHLHTKVARLFTHKRTRDDDEEENLTKKQKHTKGPDAL